MVAHTASLVHIGIISRFGFSQYFAKEANRVPPQAKCLSWEEKHAALIPNCHPERIWSLGYHACRPPEERRRPCNTSRIDSKRRKLHTDLVAVAEDP